MEVTDRQTVLGNLYVCNCHQ